MFVQLVRISRPALLKPRQLESRISIHSRSLRTRPGQLREHPPETSSVRQPDSINFKQTDVAPPKTPDVSSVLSNLDPSENQLLAPVHIPEDKNAVLKSDHPATNILAQSGLVVTRQIEMMNIFLGFEQANRYVIMDPQGNHLGYMAEHDGGIAKTMGRQWFSTHRAFTTHVFDKHAREVLRFHRPFSWINSRIRVYDALEPGSHAPKSEVTAVSTAVQQSRAIDGTHAISNIPIEAMRIIGETHSEWAPLRRKYNLFLAHELNAASGASVAGSIGQEPSPSDLPQLQRRQLQSDNFAQFAFIDEPFLSWDFSLKGEDNRLIGSVNRKFRGFGREIFTDTGMYILRMDAAGLEDEAQSSHLVSQSHRGERAYAEAVGGKSDKMGMTLDQRALMLAMAVTLDFDYFSRHSSGGSGWMLPLWMGGGGEAAGGAAGAGAAGAEVGAAEAGGAVISGAGRGVAGAAGTAGVGAGEGAIAGAGSLAGYEAMQRGMGRGDSEPSTDTSGQSENNTSSPTQSNDLGQSGDQYDSQSPQSGWGDVPPENQDVWGNGEQDPWSQPPASADGGGEGGGIVSQIWESFFGD